MAENAESTKADNASNELAKIVGAIVLMCIVWFVVRPWYTNRLINTPTTTEKIGSEEEHKKILEQIKNGTFGLDDKAKKEKAVAPGMEKQPDGTYKLMNTSTIVKQPDGTWRDVRGK
jgi:hypothetical protein